jgi:cytochrome c oxidase subunit 2
VIAQIDRSFRLWPEKASTLAPRIDALFYFLLGVTAFFTLLIFVMILYLGLKYRRKAGSLPVQVHANIPLEIAWTVIPLVLVMIMFVWATSVYVSTQRAPAGAMEIHVIGKQWMWKTQHPEGPREINALHIPRGRPIKLIMTSQDVVHSFYIPAFRIKQDVLPGRYSTEWFEATQVGEYHLFCAEYCGAQHSGMIGSIVVMEPAKYQAWLAGAGSDEPMAVSGQRLFAQFQCITCHGQRGPTLAGVYNSMRPIQKGKPVLADESYLRRAILEPNAELVEGFSPLMPTYAGQLSEEQLTQLIVYIKSLK